MGTGGGRYCERGEASKYLVCITTARKQMQLTMCCCCESVRLSNCPIKPPVLLLNVYFANLYNFTARGSNNGDIEIKLKLQSTFHSL